MGATRARHRHAGQRNPPRGGRRGPRLLAAFGVVALSTLADAQPVAPDEAAAVMDHMRRILADEAFAVPVGLTVEVRLLFVPPDEEMERLARDVSGRPEHPGRDLLRQYRLRSGGTGARGDQWTERLWLAEDDLFRVNSQYADDLHADDAGAADAGPFTDRARRGRSAWSMTASSLEHAESDGSFAAQMARSELRSVLLMLIAPAAHILAAPDALIGDPERGPDGAMRLTVTPPWANGSPARLSFIRLSTGEVALGEVRFAATPGDQADAPRIIELSRHRMLPGEDYPIPGHAMVRTAAGRPERSLTVTAIEVITREDVLAVTATPSAARPDPIRGWDSQETSGSPEIDALMQTATHPTTTVVVRADERFRLWHAAAALGVSVVCVVGARRLWKRG